MATFEKYISDKLKPLSEDDGMAFLLDAIPFIREHQSAEEGAAESGRGVGTLISDAKVHREKSVLARFMWETRFGEKTPETFAQVWEDTRREQDSLYACRSCGTALLVDVSRAHMACPSCGMTADYQEDSKPTPDDHTRVTMISSFAYKRLNHFFEHVSTLQGKENTNIPDEVIAQVRREFEKARLTSPDDITQKRVRGFLKKLGYSKLYEHSWHIVSLLGGKGVVKIPPELEAKLKWMFQEIQAPFERCKPEGRKNFLSYSFVLYKFCELLGEDEYLPHFSLLKSREKLQQADLIWKAICAELSWQYIPTL